jgi:hypothetical protein
MYEELKPQRDRKLAKLATKYRKQQLTETQKKVAEEIVYKGLTGKKEDDIAKEYNTNRTTIWRWKALPAFNEYMNKIAHEFQRSHLPDVNKILRDIMKNGTDRSKLKAIELFYRNQGMFKDIQEVKHTEETRVNVDDVLKELDDLDE